METSNICSVTNRGSFYVSDNSDDDCYTSSGTISSIRRSKVSQSVKTSSEDEGTVSAYASRWSSSGSRESPIYTPNSVFSFGSSTLSIHRISTNHSPVTPLSMPEATTPTYPNVQKYRREMHVRLTELDVTTTDVVTMVPLPTRIPREPQQPHNKYDSLGRKRRCRLRCFRKRRYEKVSEVFPKQQSTSWLLRKKTLLCFSSASMVLSLLACGLLLAIYINNKKTLCYSKQKLNATDPGVVELIQEPTQSNYLCAKSSSQKILHIQMLNNSTDTVYPGSQAIQLPIVSDSVCRQQATHTGWYLVMSAMTVNTSLCQNSARQWTHRIMLQKYNATLDTIVLAASVKKCCYNCIVYVESSYTSGVFQLDKGEMIHVLIDLPTTETIDNCIRLIRLGG